MAYIQMSTLAASIISITYGVAVVPEHGPNIERADKALVESKETAMSYAGAHRLSCWCCGSREV